MPSGPQVSSWPGLGTHPQTYQAKHPALTDVLAFANFFLIE